MPSGDISIEPMTENGTYVVLSLPPFKPVNVCITAIVHDGELLTISKFQLLPNVGIAGAPPTKYTCTSTFNRSVCSLGLVENAGKNVYWMLFVKICEESQKILS